MLAETKKDNFKTVQFTTYLRLPVFYFYQELILNLAQYKL